MYNMQVPSLKKQNKQCTDHIAIPPSPSILHSCVLQFSTSALVSSPSILYIHQHCVVTSICYQSFVINIELQVMDKFQFQLKCNRSCLPLCLYIYPCCKQRLNAFIIQLFFSHGTSSVVFLQHLMENEGIIHAFLSLLHSVGVSFNFLLCDCIHYRLSVL